MKVRSAEDARSPALKALVKQAVEVAKR